MAISHRPSLSGTVLPPPHRHRRRLLVISKIRISTFYPLHPQISSAKFIRNLPVATSTYPHFTIGRIVQYLVKKFILSVVQHLGNVGVIRSSFLLTIC